MTVKVETLNTWGGRIFEPLMEHVEREANGGVDIFCFQEVCDTGDDERQYCRPITAEHLARPVTDEFPARADLYKKLTAALPEFNGYHRSAQDGIDFIGPVDYELRFGLASFTRKDIRIQKEDDVFVFGKRNDQIGDDCATMGRNIQYLQFEQAGRQVTVANFHGLWHPGGKGDVPGRMEQSRNIYRFLAGLVGDVVLAGDFNMRPDTESMALLESAGLRNMITQYGIESTRSSWYTKPEKLGSFVLASQGIEVQDFRVVPDDVSDHLALQLEFA